MKERKKTMTNKKSTIRNHPKFIIGTILAGKGCIGTSNNQWKGTSATRR
jgi:hypothetical protein